MSDSPKSEKNINEQFQNLSKNLTEVLRAAWNRPEREKFQKELENGINELGTSLKKVSEEFQESNFGQQLKNGVKDVRTKVEQGKLEENIREELHEILMKINNELEVFAKKIKQTEEYESGSENDIP